MHIKIYGQPSCPSCKDAIRECEKRADKGLTFEYIQVGKDISFADYLPIANGQRTFPKVFVETEFQGQDLGTYQNLLAYLKTVDNA